MNNACKSLKPIDLTGTVRVRNLGPCRYNCEFILCCLSTPRDKFYFQTLDGSKEREKAKFIRWGLEGLPTYKGHCPEDLRRYRIAQGLIDSITMPDRCKYLT